MKPPETLHVSVAGDGVIHYTTASKKYWTPVSFSKFLRLCARRQAYREGRY